MVWDAEEVADLEVAEVDGNVCIFATSTSENARLYKGFCKTPFVGLVDINREEIVWVENPFTEESGSASMFLKFLLDKGIEIIISGDKPGAGVFPILERAGIKVYVDSGSVKDAIHKYKKGALKLAKDGYPKGDCR